MVGLICCCLVLISKQLRFVLTSAVCERDPQIIHAFNDRVSHSSPYECPDREDKIAFFFFLFLPLRNAGQSSRQMSCGIFYQTNRYSLCQEGYAYMI